MKYQLLRLIPSRQGFDVLVAFTDAEKKIDQSKWFYFESKTEPTLETMAGRLAHIASNIEGSLNVKERVYVDIEDIESVLKAKGLILAGETWEDFKAAEVAHG